MVAWIALQEEDSSCGLCRVDHHLASCMVGMTQNLGISPLCLLFYLCFPGYYSYFKFIVMKKVDEVFPKSMYICTFFINKIEVQRVNQEKRLVEFAGYITLADNQQ